MAELVEITSADDPRLADYRDLRDVELRKSVEAAEGLFLAEGEKVVRRAAAAGYAARSFLMAPRWLPGLADVLDGSDAPCFVVSEALAEEITGFHVHRGALASLQRRPPTSLDALLDAITSPRPRVAVLEGFADHANVGSAFRNAAALGIDAVIVSPTCADPLYRRAIKTSMGNVFSVPWTRATGMLDLFAALRARGYATAALTLADDSITLDELVALDLPAQALVLGSEGHGVHPKTAAQVDHRVRIPMTPGVDSLNVTAAAAIAFYLTR